MSLKEAFSHREKVILAIATKKYMIQKTAVIHTKFTLMVHKQGGGHAEKAHKVGIFIDMIHVAEGLNPMLCSENGWLVLWKSCGASGYGSFSSYPPSLISPLYATGRFTKKNKELEQQKNSPFW